MKDLKNLKDAKVLSKMEQKAIKGGLACRYPDNWCPPGTYCCFEMGGLCRADWQPCPM